MMFIPDALGFSSTTPDSVVVKHVEINDADLVLADVVCGYKVTPPGYMRLGLSSIFVYSVYFSYLKVTCFYTGVETKINSLHPEARLVYSRALMGFERVPFGARTCNELVRAVLTPDVSQIVYLDNEERNAFIFLKAWLTSGRGSEIIPYTRISGEHIRFFSWHELAKIGCDELWSKASYAIRFVYRNRHVMHEAWAVGVIIWWLVAPEQIRNLVTHSNIFCRCKSALDWVKTIKPITSTLKGLQNIVQIDLTPLFELEVLVNRGVGNVDWDAERQNRTQPKLANIPKAEIHRLAMDIFNRGRLQGLKPIKLDFDSFFKTRWEWAPPGSVHSQYKEDLVNMPTERELKNKTFVLSATESKPFEYYIEREPEILAWPSVKYEWGKERAIYGTDLTGFVISAFGFFGCERTLDSRFPIGKAAESEAVHKTVKNLLKRGTQYCLDYEDFNSQHSNEAMQAVLLAYLDVFRGHLHPEQAKAIVWVANSTFSTTVIDKQGNYKTNGTLMSGWRLTSFVNSVLNAIYFDYNAGELRDRAIHNGDDALVSVDNLSQVLKLNKNLVSSGVRIQASKCFLGAIGEFLRVDHLSGNGAQYLARGVSTLVHGRTEAAEPNDVRELVSATMDRCQALRARGGDTGMVDRLESILVDRISVHFNVDGAVLHKLITHHRVVGGLSEAGDADLKSIIKATQTAKYPSGYNELFKRVQPGASDYAAHVVRRFLPKAEISKVTKLIQKATIGRIVAAEWDLTISENHDVLSTAYKRNCYKMFRKTAGFGKAKLARAYNVPLAAFAELDSYAFRRLMEYQDPISWLPIIA